MSYRLGDAPMRPRFTARRRKRRMVSRYKRLPARPVPSANYQGLGFSLKPPKRLRKLGTKIKKAVTLKRVLTAGAIVAGAIVAGPAALAAGRAVLRGGKAGTRAVGSFVLGKLRPRSKGTPGIIPSMPGSVVPGSLDIPASESPTYVPTGPSQDYQAAQATSNWGGGGGGVAQPAGGGDETEQPAGPTPQDGAKILPALVIGAVVLGGLALAGGARRGRN